MKNLKGLLMFSVILSLLSCSMSAKTENKNGTIEATKGEIIVLNKVEFLTKVFDYEKNQTEWVYEGDKPCIVDFYADWCGPCKKIAPVLKDLAAQYEDDIVIYKINVDEEKELAAVFGVQSIPTLLFIPKDGDPQILRGVLSRDEFVKQIDGFLLSEK
jgi:thioredoxin